MNQLHYKTIKVTTPTGTGAPESWKSVCGVSWVARVRIPAMYFFLYKIYFFIFFLLLTAFHQHKCNSNLRISFWNNRLKQQTPKRVLDPKSDLRKAFFFLFLFENAKSFPISSKAYIINQPLPLISTNNKSIQQQQQLQQQQDSPNRNTKFNQ